MDSGAHRGAGADKGLPRRAKPRVAKGVLFKHGRTGQRWHPPSRTFRPARRAVLAHPDPGTRRVEISPPEAVNWACVQPHIRLHS
jgi:hypothetical protein